MPHEFREMGLSCSAFRFDHGQKGRADAEALDQRVFPFRFVQRDILLCLLTAGLTGRVHDVFIELLDGVRR